MYIYQVALAIKTGLFTFFILTFSAAYSQKDLDSTALIKEAEALLDKKINVSWNGGSLSELCEHLSKQEGLKFAYSNYQINNITVASQKLAGISLSEALGILLQGSGFSYLVIGETIAIVRDKNHPEKNSNASSPPNTAHKGNSSISHIYPASPLVNRLTSYEKKILKRIYGKELKVSARKRKNPVAIGRDTVNKKSRPALLHRQLEDRHYYLGLNTGWETHFIKYHSISSLGWKKEASFSSDSHGSLFIEAEGGVFCKSLILSAAIGIHTLSFKNNYTINAPAPPPGPAPPPDPKTKRISDSYSVIKLPLQVEWYQQKRRLYYAGGGGLGVDFIKRTAHNGSLKEYYELKVPGDKYKERTYHLSYALLFRGELGYKINSSLFVSGGVQAALSLSPYLKNQLYKIYPNTLSLKFSLRYSFR